MNIKKIDIILFVTILLGLRALYDVNISQAIVTIGFLAIFGLIKVLEHKKLPDLNDEIKKELEVIKSNISGIMIKNSIKPNEQLTSKRFF